MVVQEITVKQGALHLSLIQVQQLLPEVAVVEAEQEHFQVVLPAQVVLFQELLMVVEAVAQVVKTDKTQEVLAAEVPVDIQVMVVVLLEDMLLQLLLMETQVQAAAVAAAVKAVRMKAAAEAEEAQVSSAKEQTALVEQVKLKTEMKAEAAAEVPAELLVQTVLLQAKEVSAAQVQLAEADKVVLI